MTAHEALVEYRFYGYRLDVRQRKLFKPEGEIVSLSSRAFDALLVLLERHGETLTKAQLMQAVWPNAVVEENNLNQAISSLRKVFGDTKTASNFILTVPGRGYCFVAPVEVVPLSTPAPVLPAPEDSVPAMPPGARALPLSPLASVVFGALVVVALVLVLLNRDPPTEAGDPAVAARLPAAPVAAPEPEVIQNSIAVLPFTLLTPEPDNGLFALGLHDELINQLSRIRSLNVISRESVMALVGQQLPPTEFARLLRVQSVMSGTLMFVDEDVRISLQMLDAATGVTLWAETYEADKKDLGEVISIQSDIAVNVASALEAEVLMSEQATLVAMPTKSFPAYRFNLAAKQAHYQQDYAQEWELSRQAIELDPDYFDALHTFSSVNTVMVATPMTGMTSTEHFQLALESAEHMIAIAPRRSEGYALKAVALSTTKDWAGVADMLERLADMDTPPSELHYVALILMAMGEFDRAIEIYEDNLVTEPVNLFSRGFLIEALELSGKRDESYAEYVTGEELSPVWWGDTVNILLALGRGEPLQDVEELIGISPATMALLSDISDVEKVRRAVHDYNAAPDKVPAEATYYSALAAYVGEHETAVELMRFSLQDVWLALHWLWLPVFDETRELESFRQLLRDSGMVAYWEQYGWPQVCRPVDATFVCDWRAYPESVIR
ncbi:MAG TPA: winged helix-turn-helix domain-containing protein [Pseudomonadales bacterium]